MLFFLVKSKQAVYSDISGKLLTSRKTFELLKLLQQNKPAKKMYSKKINTENVKCEAILIELFVTL